MVECHSLTSLPGCKPNSDQFLVLRLIATTRYGARKRTYSATDIFSPWQSRRGVEVSAFVQEPVH